MAGENNTYRSKYFTAEEIDQRLLQGYYDDAVKAGYKGTVDSFKSNLAKIGKLGDELDIVKTIDNGSLNNYETEGIYNINTVANEFTELPVSNTGEVSMRLTVLASTSNNNTVITQVLNLNNNAGGEGNMYIRSCQNGNWKPWAKLQTNVEVGLIDQTKMDALDDNGIYSGILSTTGETFVIICINNYAIAQQVGVQHISHLKYSLVVGTGEVKIEKRTRDAYGFWTEWVSLDEKSLVEKEKIRAIAAEVAIVEHIDKKIATEINKIKIGDTIVGQAREIHSRNGKTVTDSFIARTTAGSGTIGDGVASLKSVGGNIVKNLLPKISADDWSIHGDSILVFDGNIAVLSGSAWEGLRTKQKTLLKLIASHKYYISLYTYTNDALTIYYNIGSTTIGYTNVISGWNYSSFIITDIDVYNFFRINPTTAFTNLCISNILAIDLTEMFNAGKEPDQATCDKLFGTMDALPLGLTIANPTEFKSIGFNHFNPDNVLEGKAIVNNAIVNGDKKIAVIPCLPCKVGTGENNGYCIQGEFGDDIKVYITPLNPMEVDGELYMHELTKDATTDTYVPLIKGYLLVEVPTTTNLCAHFLWSEDKCKRDTYEPYHESTVELPVIPQMSEWGLAGIQSSDTLACDEIDFERGVYVKKIHKKVFNGSEIWYKSGVEFYSGGVLPVNKKGQYNQVLNWNGYSRSITVSSVAGSFNLNNEIDSSTLYIHPLESVGATDISTWKAYLANNPLEIYYELATPEEYPLPKVDNNYISSDYGVEQFDSVVPCNANNLYYMRSLAGETRNFLDRMYDNTTKTDAKEVADYITNGIDGNKELATNAPNLALRALFVAAGAEYNNSGADKTKTAPWGEIVTHKAGHYYLNGLGDITETQMMAIYNAGRMTSITPVALYKNTNIRTAIPAVLSGGEGESVNIYYMCSYAQGMEVFRATMNDVLTTSRIAYAFEGCTRLKYIVPILKIGSITASYNIATAFKACRELVLCKLYNLKISVSFSDSPLLSKESILYTIQQAAPTSAITITLHADAYARLNPDLEENADIKSALEAQPLVTLASA